MKGSDIFTESLDMYNRDKEMKGKYVVYTLIDIEKKKISRKKHYLCSVVLQGLCYPTKDKKQ